MLRNIFAVLTLIAWGLWFGGLAGLMLAVVTLSHVARAQMVYLVPQIFRVFEHCQLVLAAVALCGVVGWWLVQRSPTLLAVFAFLGLAAVGAAINAGYISPAMNHLIQAGKSSSAEFAGWHREITAIYKAVATALLIAGAMLATVGARTSQAGPGSVPPA